MRRWLAILLLTLLPLQFSWAAVTVYCGHESGEQAQHLGHHEHQHADQAGADDGGAPADPTAPAGFDFDCGHCHGTCASLPTPVVGLAALSVAAHPTVASDRSLRTLAQSPPERPQWAVLA